MTSAERQEAVVKLLLKLEPKIVHDDICPAKRTEPGICNCYQLRNAKKRALALDEAGLLCALAKKE